MFPRFLKIAAKICAFSLLRFRRLVPAAVIFLISAQTAAQYRFEIWTTEQGLPYKTVKSVLQTRDGYVWAATDDGLARFDGVRFTVFNTANAKNLPTNRLDHLVEAADGSLWMASDGRGLVRYKDGFFTNYTTAVGLPDERVTYLAFVADKNLLRVVTKGGVARFDGERFVREDFDNFPFDEKNTPMMDNTGALIVRRGDEIRRFADGAIEIFRIPPALRRFDFSSPYRDRAGNFWLPGAGAYYILRFRGGAADVFTERDDIPGKFNKLGQPGGFTIRIFEDKQGNLWLGSRDGGLSIYKDGEFRLLTKEKDGLPSDGFHSFAEDREGGVWAGTDDGGLARFSPRIITTFSAADGLTGDSIYPLLETREGAVWIGAWLTKKGLTKYENGKISEIPTKGSLFTALFEDRAGALWVGSHNYFGKIENGKFKMLANTGKVYRAIAQDGAGAMWLGTEDGELWRIFDGETRIFTRRDGLPGGIYNLHFDRRGTLWIGTSGGLAKYENGAFTVFTEADGLSGNYIRSIYENADGALWFGSFDNGITRLKDGKFSAIRMQNGLHDNGAFQILEDDAGRFWISSNRGIYRVSRQELNDFADGKISSVTSVAYGVKDGMLDAECNGGAQPAGFESKRDGRLWFPTQKGVAVIDPKNLTVNAQPPNVVIEDVLIDRQPVARSERLEIAPENDSLEIHYTGLSFNKPEQIKFKYRLEGLDADWIDAGTQRKVYFTHLPPGEYVFRVAAANVDGVWNEAGAAIKISVRPPFYRTVWFLFLCAVGVAGFIALVFNSRIRQLEKRRRAQEEFSRKLMESQERERQRIAAELHDSIGQDLLIIKNWALIGLQNGADSNKQLGEISETASAAIEEVREIAYNLRPYHLDDLGLTKALESMLERIAKSAPIRFRRELDAIDGFFPKEAEINFYRIVQECLNNVVKHSAATEAGVRIKRNDKTLRLSVWDNGKGFDVNALASVKARQSGFGMAGVSERVRILGGKLTINSVPNEGTNINLTVNAKG
jgi:signal transduction histidine kinase/ligand-binding sensor domain-containing protein